MELHGSKLSHQNSLGIDYELWRGRKIEVRGSKIFERYGLESQRLSNGGYQRKCRVCLSAEDYIMQYFIAEKSSISISYPDSTTQLYPWTHPLPIDRRKRAAVVRRLTAEIEKVKDWLGLLGFDLCGKFKFDERYHTAERGQTLARATFTNGLLRDIGNGKKKKAEITVSSLLQHFYQNPRQRTFKGFPVLTVDDRLNIWGKHLYLDENEQQGILAQVGTIGCRQRDEYSSLLFDIDQHDAHYPGIAARVLHYLLSVIRYSPFIFLEPSFFNGGLHGGLCFDKILTDEQRSAFRKRFREAFQMEIEIATRFKAISLPSSGAYSLVEITNLEAIRDHVDTAIEMRCFETIIEAIDFTTAHFEERVLPIRLLMDFIQPVVHLADPTPEPGQLSGVSDTSASICPQADAPQVRESATLRHKMGKEKDIMNGFPMRRGRRWEAMNSLALYCVGHGHPFEEYMIAVRSNQVDSFELNYWTEDRFEKECRGIYGAAVKNFRPLDPKANSSPDGFISNAALLSDELRSATRERAIQIHRIYGLVHPPKYRKSYQKLLHSIEVLLVELCGKIIYDLRNPRSIDPVGRKEHKRRAMAVGFSFDTKTFLPRLKEHYDLPGSIKRQFGFVARYGLFLDQFKHNDAGYSFGYGKSPKQFTLFDESPGEPEKKLLRNFAETATAIAEIETVSQARKARERFIFRQVLMKERNRWRHMSPKHLKLRSQIKELSAVDYMDEAMLIAKLQHKDLEFFLGQLGKRKPIQAMPLHVRAFRRYKKALIRRALEVSGLSDGSIAGSAQFY